MNRKQNRLLFILFFTLLMCMNLAKAWHIAGKCEFQASGLDNSRWLNTWSDYFDNKICDDGSSKSMYRNCVVNWELYPSGFTSNLTGNRHIQFRPYIDYFNLLKARTSGGQVLGYGMVPDIGEELKETQESGTLYRWNQSADGTTNRFWIMSIKKRSRADYDTRNLHRRSWMVFEVIRTRTKDKISTKNNSVQSPKEWEIKIHSIDLENAPANFVGSVRGPNSYNEGDCVESLVPFDSGAVSGAKFILGYDKDKIREYPVRTLEWGIEDGRFMVLPDSESEPVPPYSRDGDLSSGNYSFMLEDKNPPNKDEKDKRPYYIKVTVSKTPGSAPDTGFQTKIEYFKKDNKEKTINTGIKVLSVLPKDLKVVPIANRSTDGEQKLEQKENEATEMKYLSSINFTLGYEKSKLKTYPTRTLKWGIKDGKLMIIPDFSNEAILPTQFAGSLGKNEYNFEFEDKTPLNKDLKSIYSIKIAVNKKQTFSDSRQSTGFEARITYFEKDLKGKKKDVSDIKVFSGKGRIIPIEMKTTVGEGKTENENENVATIKQGWSHAQFKLTYAPIFGKTETQLREIYWGTTQDGQFKIMSDFDKDQLKSVYNFEDDLSQDKYSFEYIDKFQPLLGTADQKNGEKYYIKIAVDQSEVPKVNVTYSKRDSKNKNVTTRVTIKNPSADIRVERLVPINHLKTEDGGYYDNHGLDDGFKLEEEYDGSGNRTTGQQQDATQSHQPPGGLD